MKLLALLRSSSAGAVAVEFALVAPVFFAFTFGMFEASRIFWVKQTLDEVAYSTVRCMTVSSECDTVAAQKQYAVDRAQSLGVSLTPAMVTTVSGVSCKGEAASNSVTVSRPSGSPLQGIFPAMPENLTSRACFPKLI